MVCIKQFFFITIDIFTLTLNFVFHTKRNKFDRTHLTLFHHRFYIYKKFLSQIRIMLI
ncbi:hypothetical protein IMSAGC022_01271 [Alistipes sp.]|nr:hypothetical protein IMSAGC022_01271 [Alistipes sp.]